MTHPLNDAGGFDGSEPDAPFTIHGLYLGRRPHEETFDRDGLRMTFRGWSYALEEYTEALEAAGFLIERLREPAATAAGGRGAGKLSTLAARAHVSAHTRR